MMPKSRTEEQFPLLLFVVGDQELSQNNRRIFGKGRLDGITSGATAIITEWPNYLSSCWVTAFICGVTIFVITLMLTSCMSLQYHHRLPRCVPNYQLDNQTIHLVHSSRRWTPKQLELLDNITHSFPHYKVHLVIIDNKILTSLESTTTTITNEKPKEKKLMIRAFTPYKTMSIERFLEKHPNIFVSHLSYNQFFENTPLFIKWMELSDQLKLFAIRIIQMWQFGGLSFDLMEFKVSPPKKLANITDYAEKKLKKLVKYGRDTYKKMDSEIVSVDHNGLHMECKTPCHAFFGKILMKLKRAKEDSTPKSILKKPMMAFCMAGVIDKLFCHDKNVLFK